MWALCWPQSKSLSNRSFKFFTSLPSPGVGLAFLVELEAEAVLDRIEARNVAGGGGGALQPAPAWRMRRRFEGGELAAARGGRAVESLEVDVERAHLERRARHVRFAHREVDAVVIEGRRTVGKGQPALPRVVYRTIDVVEIQE